MTKTFHTSTVSTDDWTRDLLHLDPNIIASLAATDVEAQRRLGGEEPTELDGLDVLMRRVLVAALAMRTDRPTCVRLLTERQAERNGWPDVRTGNLAQLFVWAMLAADRPSDTVFPPLVGADETVTDPCPWFTSAPLPPVETLMAEFWPVKVTSETLREVDEGRAAWASGAASTADALRVAPAHTLAKDGLGLDPAPFIALDPSVFHPNDPRTPTQAIRFMLCWIVEEALDTLQAMQREEVFVVRLKTERDAELARYPGATASNLALLLAAALYQGSGVTLLVLAPHPTFAASLVEASQALAEELRNHSAPATYAEGAMLEDLAAREYVHVGRFRSRLIGSRLYDQARQGAKAAA